MEVKNVVLAKDFDIIQDLLSKDNEKNIIIGGGLWQRMNRQVYDHIVDLSKLSLAYITVDKDVLKIGASTTLREIENNPELISLADGLLPKAIHQIMGIGVRNVATIGGSVMGRYAFSDILPCLLALNTKLVFYNNPPISIKDWITKRPNKRDILVELQIPKLKSNGYFYKVGRTHLDFALLNVAIVKSKEINIVVGARPSIAAYAFDAMKFINQQDSITKEIIHKTVDIAINELKFGSNNKASEEYRKILAKTYITRGLNEVLKK